MDESILPLLRPLLDSPNGPWYVVAAAAVLLLLKNKLPAVASRLPKVWEFLKRLLPATPKPAPTPGPAPVTPAVPSNPADLKGLILQLILSLLTQQAAGEDATDDVKRLLGVLTEQAKTVRGEK